ncbi:LysE family translocator [Neptuniibacter caesariensis]|uniref:Threonine transporter RhtB n=1 Tax=Neptuniibacter caesariensis TaxID=207954 RepID=A0A7U8GSM7_NEPCE|nr:LysE family translocator [Neptuniibacter caesariensis]EAR62652.1 hypothetical protein MED92_06023 [Oceanospirillum sp. MED92] [Neptuniibacter caesariensis]
MFEHFLWLPFLITITALTITPGVDSVLVIRNSARGGSKDGMYTSLGICLGLFAHALISAAGLSLILLSSAELFTLLKLAGAAYLIWLGVQSIRSALKHQTLPYESVSSVAEVSVFRSLREGLLSNVLNPKTIVFYMAFLPQFIDPDHPPIPQALMMAGIHFVLAMLWQGGLVLMVKRARVWLQQPKVSKTLDSITGLILVAFGARLVTSSAP